MEDEEGCSNARRKPVNFSKHQDQPHRWLYLNGTLYAPLVSVASVTYTGSPFNSRVNAHLSEPLCGCMKRGSVMVLVAKHA